MENQGKRLLLAVGLALAVMLAWNMLFPSKPDETAKSKQGSAAVGAAGVPSGQRKAPPLCGGQAVTGEAPVVSPDDQIVLSFPKFVATFSRHGGALVSWQLTDKRYQHDDTKGELLPKRPDTGAFFVCFPQSKYDVTGALWTAQKVSDTELRYTLSTPTIDLEKTYVLHPDAYLVALSIKATVKVPPGELAPQTMTLSSFVYQDPKVKQEGSNQVAARVWHSSTLRGETHKQSIPNEVSAAPRWEDQLTWTGFEHPYLFAVIAPEREAHESISKYTYGGAALGVAAGDGLMRTDIVFPSVTLKAGDPAIERDVVAYFGPKNYHELDAANAAAGFSTGFTATIDFGWFGVIGRPMLWLLTKFYDLVGNWGVAIIMLTFLVKALTLYWTTKSMRSMKAMASLAPQMKALQEKYKDDRQRLQAETMALYKQHKVNPIAGCLPILLQMPIWIALYRMLSNAGELYHAPFISGWIDDLTATDPYHVLPVVLVLTMFAQARLQPATGDSRQQKFLQYGMPLMFGVMSFFFPSGLTIYIFTNTVLGALHSLYMNKYDKQSLALAAQMKQAQADAEAKAAIATAKGSKGAAKPARAAKPVIDVVSKPVETSVDASIDADEDDDETASADEPSASNPRPGQPRAKRKKRRR